LIGRHHSHISRIDAVNQLEQTAAGGLFYESVEDIVNDVFEVGEKAIYRGSGRRSIKTTIQPNDIERPSITSSPGI